MSLTMARPFKHPKTGVYWLRKVVPEELRGVVGKRELKQTLGTKDPAQARALAGPVAARFETVLAGARQGRTVDTEREVQALCGTWYRARLVERDGDPGDLQELEDEIDHIKEQGRPEPGEPASGPNLEARDLTAALGLLQAHGYVSEPATLRRVAAALWRARWLLEEQTLRRALGDWSPDPNVDRFPPPVPRAAPSAPPVAVSFSSLVAGWAAERGTTGKALYERERTAKALETFLGHDDATRVTADDVVRWKEAGMARGLTVKSVANNIGELQPIWKWGKLNRKLAFAENPFAGLAPRPKKGGPRARGAFTTEEARAILTAARKETGTLRWLPWLACFTGARISELCQATRADVSRIEPGGGWSISLHEETAGNHLKNPHSARMVPLHPALIAEGFMTYVQAIPAGLPIFPDAKPDKFGNRGGTATKNHGRWVRRTVGVTDTKKDPAHGWRHLFKERAQIAGLPKDVHDALTGHLDRSNEGEGYGRGLRFMPEVTAAHVAKMSNPLDGAELSADAAARPCAA